MTIDDRISKSDAFTTIVGKERCQGKFPGDVPDFEIKPENVDAIYLTVKKMQRCYAKDPSYPVAQYFADSFSRIEKAYLSSDPTAFKEAVKGLMIDIDCE